MSTVRAVARGVMVWALFAAYARADSRTVNSGGQDNWTFYVSGADDKGASRDLSGYLANTTSAEGSRPLSRLSASSTSSTSGSDPGTPPAVSGPGNGWSSVGSPSPAPAPPPPAAPPTATPTPPPTPTPTAPPVLAPTPNPTPTATADALLNFGTSNFPEAGVLTTGNPQPWYVSKSVLSAFQGNTPTHDQQTQFENDVLSHVRHTFELAGLDPKLTIDPTVASSHTLSVVSGAFYGPNTAAIGITDVGRNGFGFIDNLKYATNPDQLAWAVAHNISHELMHAFGVGIHPDTTGNYIDAATATWNLLTSADTTFSPAARDLIAKTNFGAFSSSAGVGNETLSLPFQPDGEQEVLATVPEPSTVAAWSVVLAGALVVRRKRAVRVPA